MKVITTAPSPLAEREKLRFVGSRFAFSFPLSTFRLTEVIIELSSQQSHSGACLLSTASQSPPHPSVKVVTSCLSRAASVHLKRLAGLKFTNRRFTTSYLLMNTSFSFFISSLNTPLTIHHHHLSCFSWAISQSFTLPQKLITQRGPVYCSSSSH